MSSFVPNEEIADVLIHRTHSTGLVNGDWTKRLYKNGELSAVVVTVTEIANGAYKISFTPDSEGKWTVWIYQTGYSGYADYIQGYVVRDAFATAASISALNNLSAADVNAEVGAALADYDAPTKAEMDAGFASIEVDVPTVEEIVAGIDSDSTVLASAEAEAALARKMLTNDLDVDRITGEYLVLDDDLVTTIASGVVTEYTRTKD